MTFTPTPRPNVGGSAGITDGITIEGTGAADDSYRIGSAGVGFITAKQFGVVGDGVTDDSLNLSAAIAEASSLGCALQLGSGTFLLGRQGSNAWCLDISQLSNVTITGTKGKTRLLMPSGMPDSSVALLRLNGCQHVTVRDVSFDGNWHNAATAITYQSDGQALGALTGNVLNVEDTSLFASSGTLVIATGASNTQTITYTGKTTTTLTGCTGGTGTVRTGMMVGISDSANGLNHTTQVDPKNHLVMIRGCSNVLFENCTFTRSYGDMVWFGFRGDPIEDGLIASRNITLRNCVGVMSARNAVTVGQLVDGIVLDNCDWRQIYTTAFDVEAQGANQYVRRIFINGGYYGLWWNPMSIGRNQNQAISITGAGVYGLLDADAARAVTVSNATVEGSIGIWASKFVTIFNNHLITDYDMGATNGGAAPILVDHVSDGIDILHNSIYDRGAIVGGAYTPYADPGFASIMVQQYPGMRPAGVRVIGNKIKCRNGRSGIKVSGAGAQIGGTENYTASTITTSSVVVTSAGWVTDEHRGKAIYCSGLQASVTANTSDTLVHTGWFLPSGSGAVAAAPSAGSFKLVSQSGVVTIEGNDIDCRDDGYGAGGYGIALYSGLNGGAIKCSGNIIKNATIYGIVADFSESLVTHLQLANNHVYDDAQTKTTTTALHFVNAANISQLVMHGNTQSTGITHLDGLTSGSWQTSNSFPSSWAGYQDPNSLIDAPASATYHRLDSKVIYVKQSPEGSTTGWQAVQTLPRAVVRGIGTARATAGTSIDLTGYMPPSVAGDIELLVCFDMDATTEPVLSTPAGFVKKISGYSTVTYSNRPVIFWRRFQTGMPAPVVSIPAGLAAAVVVSLRDIIPYGDPFDTAQFQADPDGNNAITFPVATTTQDNALVLNVLTTYCGGGGATPGHFDSWANASLSELEEIVDSRLVLGSDILNISVLSSRKVAAGSVSATTAQGYDGSQSGPTITLTFKPAVVSARATGSITCVTKANLADTDFITIGDGISVAKLYEFDVAGNGVTAGRVQVNVSADTTAAQVATRLRTAILANQPGFLVVDNTDGTLTITHAWVGAGGNVAMTENVTNAGFTVVGLSGGAG